MKLAWPYVQRYALCRIKEEGNNNYKIDKMYKEATAAYLNVMFWHLAKRLMENYTHLQEQKVHTYKLK